MQEFFSWEGRLNRRPYIVRNLVLSVVSLAAFHLPGIWKIELQDPLRQIVLVIGVVAVILGWIQTIKRIHDFGKTGWLSLLSFLPFIKFPLALVLMIYPGTDGANKYGNDPLKKGGLPPDQSIEMDVI